MDGSEYETDTRTATKQAVSDAARKIRNGEKGVSLNPSGKGGFGDNPENRSNGSWKREDTPRYKLEQMMTLTETELSTIHSDPNTPLFERKLAVTIINGTWPVIRDMMNEVYGRPKETVNLTDQTNYPPIIRGFVIPTAPEDFIDADIRAQLGEDVAAKVLNTTS